MRMTIAVIVFVTVLAVGGLVILASTPGVPSVQKVEQTVPQDRIPR
jgi:hypothetical protein